MASRDDEIPRDTHDKSDSLLQIVACPDCLGKLTRHGDGALMCPNCNATFPFDDGILVLRPSNLDTHKQAEDLTWQQHDHEGMHRPAWMALIHKRDDILYFMERIAPYLSLHGNVLEIGAGSCWASSLVKQKFPTCHVVSSDISPSALRKGQQVCEILGATPDASVACDGERLPFAAESFDFVFGNACIHHFSNAPEGIKSLHRVLKPGGVYYGGGELAAGRLFGAIWNSRLGLAGKRQHELGVNERVYSSRQWQQMFRRHGFDSVQLEFEKDWRYRLYHWFPALYYRLVGGLPDVFLRQLPCGIKITAIKART